MKDPDTGWVEADMTINGHALSFAESMSVRVAVSSFQMWLTSEENRTGIGHRLAQNYDHHLRNVMRAIMGSS